MKKLISKSEIHDNPQEKFPELLILSKYEILYGLFYLYAVSYVINLIIYLINLSIVGFENFILFYLMGIVLFILAISCLIRAYEFKSFTTYYSIKAFYKKTSYKLCTISQGKRYEDIHRYDIDFKTVEHDFKLDYTLGERIQQIPKEKGGVFFSKDKLASAYYIIIDDDIYLLENGFKENPFFAPNPIEENTFTDKLLNMRNTDNLFIEYLPNGDLLNVSYEEKESGKRIYLSQNIEESLLNKGLYTPLFTLGSILIFCLLVYQYVNINQPAEINNNYNMMWYRLTAWLSLLIFCIFMYYVIRPFTKNK